MNKKDEKKPILRTEEERSRVKNRKNWKKISIFFSGDDGDEGNEQNIWKIFMRMMVEERGNLRFLYTREIELIRNEKENEESLMMRRRKENSLEKIKNCEVNGECIEIQTDKGIYKMEKEMKERKESMYVKDTVDKRFIVEELSKENVDIKENLMNVKMHEPLYLIMQTHSQDMSDVFDSDMISSLEDSGEEIIYEVN